MIILDFRVDDEALTKDLGATPELANAAAIEETYFVMPVRFAVGSTEFLAYPGVYDSWRPQPIIGFATHLFSAVMTSKFEKPALCYVVDGGRLEFDGTEYAIGIASTLLPGKAESVPSAELMGAARAFRERVRVLLLQRVPQIRNHPWWTRWFPE